MEHRSLGNSDISIAPIMFGGTVLGWSLPEQNAFRVLDAFIDAGFNAIDTADSYSDWAPIGWGGSESVLGRWFRTGGKRDKVVLATKLGLKEAEGKEGLSAVRMVECVEASLRRLQTDYIDLYQAHRDDKSTPLDETLEAFSRLVTDGKVRVIGASNYSADRLNEALDICLQNGWPRYESLQPLYNLYDRTAFETALQPLCVERNLGVLPYFALAQGFLSGKYRSEEDLAKSPARADRVSRFLNPRGARILAALDRVAADYECTVTQVALAWTLAQPGVTAPVVSVTSVDQLEDVLAAEGLKLSARALATLTAASSDDLKPSRLAD
jgi:aryl-alcohol dehydrogenase-like predicted oxidoreductase